MKKIIFRSMIVIPILFACHMILFPTPIYIKELNLYLWYGLPAALFVIFTILWLSCFPYSKDCRNGGWVELLFYLLPIEVFLFLVFAQWHFLASIILAVIAFVTVCVCRFVLWKETAQNRPSKRMRKRNLMIYRRVTLFILTVFLAVPAAVAVFVYDLDSPRYTPQQELWDEMRSDDALEAESLDNAALPGTDTHLFLCFSKTLWEEYSTEKRITLLQNLVDWESQRLGIPPIKVYTEKLGLLTLGEYDRTTNEIAIDLEHMDRDPVDEVIHTCLHETYHGYQAYVVEKTDWESELANSYYFQEARSWKDNYSNYIRGGLSGYDEYAEQPLEASANAFAEEESLLIRNNIKEHLILLLNNPLSIAGIVLDNISS